MRVQSIEEIAQVDILGDSGVERIIRTKSVWSGEDIFIEHTRNDAVYYVRVSASSMRGNFSSITATGDAVEFTHRYRVGGGKSGASRIITHHHVVEKAALEKKLQREMMSENPLQIDMAAPSVGQL